jgi:hypothetical protein
MRSYAVRVSNIPHGGHVFVNREQGMPTVVWLDGLTFTEKDAAAVNQQLQDSPSLLLKLEAMAAV